MTPHASLSRIERDRVTEAARLGHELKYRDNGYACIGYIGHVNVLFSSGGTESFMKLWEEATKLWREERNRVAL